MAHRISATEAMNNAGIDTDTLSEYWSETGMVPSCCDECDDVEADGTCEHGYPSVMLALHII